jgi:hypothetical protein
MQLGRRRGANALLTCVQQCLNIGGKDFYPLVDVVATDGGIHHPDNQAAS